MYLKWSLSRQANMLKKNFNDVVVSGGSRNKRKNVWRRRRTMLLVGVAWKHFKRRKICGAQTRHQVKSKHVKSPELKR